MKHSVTSKKKREKKALKQLEAIKIETFFCFFKKVYHFKRCCSGSRFVLWEAITGCFFFFWLRQKEVTEAITEYEGWGWWWRAAAVIHSNLHSAWWDWRTPVWNCCESEIKEMSDFWSTRHWQSHFKQAKAVKFCQVWSLFLSCSIPSCYKLLSGLFGQKKSRWWDGS